MVETVGPVDPRGGSVSHRQGGVTRAKCAVMVRHSFRDLDRANGIEVEHSNRRIDGDRTKLNESYIWRDGERMELKHSDEVLEELDLRLSKCGGVINRKDKRGRVKKIKTKVPANAGVVREVILQLDPALTGRCRDLKMTPEEIRGAYDVMIEHYAELYGRENLLAISMHWDETSPHAHLLVTPIDDQGRVRQASFLADGRGGESAMAKNDRALRARMIEAGYQVSPKPTGSVRGHMKVDDYARHAEWAELASVRHQEADKALQGVKAREAAADAREDDLDGKEARLDKRAMSRMRLEREIRELAKEVQQRGDAVQQREKQLQQREQAVAVVEKQQETKAAELAEREASLDEGEAGLAAGWRDLRAKHAEVVGAQEQLTRLDAMYREAYNALADISGSLTRAQRQGVGSVKQKLTERLQAHADAQKQKQSPDSTAPNYPA